MKNSSIKEGGANKDSHAVAKQGYQFVHILLVAIVCLIGGALLSNEFK
jgi:hypothetical protein